jgi:hypothetical protein
MVKIIFHTFGIGDPEDPEIYAAFPLAEFMNTDQGRWIKANCLDPQFIIRPDARTYGQRVIVYGEVEEKSATEYFLRWDSAA